MSTNSYDEDEDDDNIDQSGAKRRKLSDDSDSDELEVLYESISATSSQPRPQQSRQTDEKSSKHSVVVVEDLEEDDGDGAGVLIVGGGVDWDLIGRKHATNSATSPPPSLSLVNLYGPRVWKENILVKHVASSCVSFHSALITKEGHVYTWGRNEHGQLGTGDKKIRFVPALVEFFEGKKISQIATGRNHTLFLTSDGVVYSCGSNKFGQLGQGTEGDDVPTPAKIDYKGKPIVKMACGFSFSMIIDSSGALFSFGSPEFGQLGHGSNGERMERAGKVIYDCETSPKRIGKFVEKDKQRGGSIAESEIRGVIARDVKCGVNHTIILDSVGRIFTWGMGGYGRLGHDSTADEFIPRLVRNLAEVRDKPSVIGAGSCFCVVAFPKIQMTYFWGQTRMTGEATMYPKPVHELTAWKVQQISCANTSIVVATEDETISWGCLPTYGELMYGDSDYTAKSSTTPKEVQPMKGLRVKQLACGYGHTLVIVEDDKEKLGRKMRWG